MIKVVIAVPTAEYARRADFYDYFHQLQLPPGTTVIFTHGQSPARNRNMMIRQALDMDATHIFFVDDDVICPPDTLMKLLAHDKDIVTGLYLMRNYPHKPIIFDKANPDGTCLWHYLKPGESGLVEIVAAGLGACLIKTDVFRKMEEPWIRLGELEKDHWCDDIGFFRRVREADIKMYCDLDVPVGHIGSMVIWPTRQDGNWYTTYHTNGPSNVSTPQLTE